MERGELKKIRRVGVGKRCVTSCTKHTHMKLKKTCSQSPVMHILLEILSHGENRQVEVQ